MEYLVLILIPIALTMCIWTYLMTKDIKYTPPRKPPEKRG
jgi:hypothetical protein